MAFEKLKKFLGRKKEMPGGLWIKCPSCEKTVFRKEVDEKLQVCTECGHHFALSPDERIAQLLDADTFTRRWQNLEPSDPLRFEGVTSYREKLAVAQKETGQKDAVWAGTGRIEGHAVAFGLTDSRFMMGSMGSVVGETIARLFEFATEKKLPVVFVSGSGGGARMYEGALSLMQMAKTSAAISRFSEAGGLFISILTNPTMGGVMASYASLGDVIIAEPRALLGFAGPRVISQTIRQELPRGFQTSEFLLEKGFIDMVVERGRLKQEVAKLLNYLT